jgi:hypothetical protein
MHSPQNQGHVPNDNGGGKLRLLDRPVSPACMRAHECTLNKGECHCSNFNIAQPRPKTSCCTHHNRARRGGCKQTDPTLP